MNCKMEVLVEGWLIWGRLTGESRPWAGPQGLDLKCHLLSFRKPEGTETP